MSSKKVRAKVFAEAAKLVAEGKRHGTSWVTRPPAACNALVEASGSFKYDEPHHVLFKELFKPDANEAFINAVTDPAWSSYWWGTTFEPKNQMARTLALLFASEMVKDTNRRKV